MTKIRLKIGDTVKVIQGKNKGKIGKIRTILKKNSMVIVENINEKFKHIKPQQEGSTGEIKKFEAPIHISNVMLSDGEIASRFRIQIQDSKKVRVLTKTGNAIS
jgi:large subunit ribosomal protein L24|tara:strand:+ start:4824 stop:5135 length:312 start_codon:yes stop_codon:yes gene_type:complete